jgi:uncharacterized protein (TIGR02145 family)
VTLSASSSGAVIDWYADDVTTSTLHTGENYTTPEIATSTTYYAQARFENTDCLSARIAVTTEVDMDGCCTAAGATVTFEEFNPCSSASTGTFWYLTDSRETNNVQTYKVKLLQDNHYWMVQDMKFGNLCKNNSYNSTSSNTTGKVTSLSGTWYGNCTAATNTNTPAARGYLYDWAAAIQKAGAFYGSNTDVGCAGTDSLYKSTTTQACQGICPEGWHIPTGSNTGEFHALHVSIGGCSTSNDICWNAASSWEGVYGGNYNPDNTLLNQKTVAYVWTSTFSDKNYALSHAHRVTGTEPGTGFGSKNVGRSVRCVMNY